MSAITVHIVDQIRHKKFRKHLSTDVQTQYLISDLIYQFELPTTDFLGRSLEYQLVRSWNRRPLNLEHTLGEMHIREGEELQLCSLAARSLWPKVEKLLKDAQDAILGQLWEQAEQKLIDLAKLQFKSDVFARLREAIETKQAIRIIPEVQNSLAERILASLQHIISGSKGCGCLSTVAVVAGGIIVVVRMAALILLEPTATPNIALQATAITEVPLSVIQTREPFTAPQDTAVPAITQIIESCRDSFELDSDFTIPDSPGLLPGESFKKVWRVRNTGTCTWSGYHIGYQSGTLLPTLQETVLQGTVLPDQTLDISIDLQAPTEPGPYAGSWAVTNSSGGKIGSELHVAIVVLKPTITNNTTPVITEEPTTSPPPSLGRIVFQSNQDGKLGIFMMNGDGSNLTQLTSHGYWPSWSPDGKRIAFVAGASDGGNEIFVMNADGSGIARVTNNPAVDWAPSWSPDGAWITFSSNRDTNRTGYGAIYTMKPDGSHQTRLTNDNLFRDWISAWSPDGTRIAFVSKRADPDPTGCFFDCNDEIYVMNTDGSGVVRLTNNPAADESPEWSPDGKLIAFFSNRDKEPGIYTMNADGSGLILVTYLEPGTSIRRITWSPDGSQIAFALVHGESSEIYSFGPGGLSQLTSFGVESSMPDWGP